MKELLQETHQQEAKRISPPTPPPTPEQAAEQDFSACHSREGANEGADLPDNPVPSNHKEEVRKKNIFSTSSTTSLAYHNVSGIFTSTDNNTRTSIAEKYSVRGGHMNPGSPKIGLLVPKKTPEIAAHAAYLSDTAQRPIGVFSRDDINKENFPEGVQIIPYINTPEAYNFITNELGQETWGLPPTLVSILKNKAVFHELVESSNVHGLEVPDYKISTLDTFINESLNLINFSKKLYSDHDISGYPLGLMIRGEESDGGYGSFLLREQEDKTILAIPNGNKEEAKIFEQNEWKQALEFTHKALKESVKSGTNPKFVVSRYLDLADSPGMSLILLDGHVEPLGWNGQIEAEGAKTCIGTTSYTPEDENLKTLQRKYENASGEALTVLLRKTADQLNIPFNSIRGVVNADFMLPSPLEEELRKKRGQQEVTVYIAESNPRFTNYTDAILAALVLMNREPTIENMQKVINEGIATHDKFPIGTADPKKVRDEMAYLDKDAIKKGDRNRAFMRVPNEYEAGIIFLGDIQKGKEKVGQALEHVIFEAKPNLPRNPTPPPSISETDRYIAVLG